MPRSFLKIQYDFLLSSSQAFLNSWQLILPTSPRKDGAIWYWGDLFAWSGDDAPPVQQLVGFSKLSFLS